MQPVLVIILLPCLMLGWKDMPKPFKRLLAAVPWFAALNELHTGAKKEISSP